MRVSIHVSLQIILWYLLVELHHSWEKRKNKSKIHVTSCRDQTVNSMFSEASVTCHFGVIFMPITVPSVDEKA